MVAHLRRNNWIWTTAVKRESHHLLGRLPGRRLISKPPRNFSWVLGWLRLARTATSSSAGAIGYFSIRIAIRTRVLFLLEPTPGDRITVRRRSPGVVQANLNCLPISHVAVAIDPLLALRPVHRCEFASAGAEHGSQNVGCRDDASDVLILIEN